jgi:hypothetical protein
METNFINGNFASLVPKSFSRSLGRQDFFYRRTLAAQMDIARMQDAAFEIAKLGADGSADERSIEPPN